MYLFLVDDNREHKKEKGVNKNAVARINHKEYKNVWLNKKCLRHSMNRIQSKYNKIEPTKSIKFICRALMIKYIS